MLPSTCMRSLLAVCTTSCYTLEIPTAGFQKGMHAPLAAEKGGIQTYADAESGACLRSWLQPGGRPGVVKPGCQMSRVCWLEQLQEEGEAEFSVCIVFGSISHSRISKNKGSPSSTVEKYGRYTSVTT